VLPAGSRIGTPPPGVEIENDQGSYFAVTRAQGSELWYYSRLVVKNVWVEPAGFPQLLEVARAEMTSRQAAVEVTLPSASEESGSSEGSGGPEPRRTP
jgi:hypothetical protein